MPAYQYVYVMKGLGRTYPGGREVLKGITLSFFPGAKIGVIGVNGSGKSTLLRIMAGLDHDFSGEAWAAEGAKVGYLPQEPHSIRARRCWRTSCWAWRRPRRCSTASTRSAPASPSRSTTTRWRRCWRSRASCRRRSTPPNGWELERTVEIAMDALRCPPGDADPATLSGGERRRVALCRLLLEHPDLLLLDEPTNHLDAESVAWLERFLKDYSGTVMVVTHDRYFLDNVTGWILELDRGRGIPYEGNYSAWLEQKQQRLAIEEKQETARQRTLEHELEWIRASPRARQAKSKARIQAFEDALRRVAGAGARHRADRHSARPAPRLAGHRGRAVCARATATGC